MDFGKFRHFLLFCNFAFAASPLLFTTFYASMTVNIKSVRFFMIKSKKFEWALYIATGLLMLLLLVSHTYNDILVTVRHGLNFWDNLLDGQILQFYNLNKVESGNIYYPGFQGCAYNILVYIIFAIWNLPLYLLERFGGVDVMNNVACLTYSKLMLVAGVMVSVWVLNRILTTLDVPQKARKLLLYVYTSSTLMLSVIFISSQYDILSIIFQLLGIHAFIKKDDKRFIFWFGVAFCFKFFSFFTFLPLLLIHRKRIFALLKSIAMMAIPWFLTRLPFWISSLVSSTGIASVSRGEIMASTRFLKTMSSATLGENINLFVMIYALLAVWCYLRDRDSKNSAFEAIFVSLVTFAAFSGTMNTLAYWPILVAPYIVLAMAIAPKYIYLNLILETVGMAALVLKNMVISPWCYFDDTLKSMIWPHILKGTSYTIGSQDGMLAKVLLFLAEPSVPGSIISFFIAAMSIMTYITYYRNSLPNLKQWDRAERCEDILFIRLGVTAVVCLLPILKIFI